jgi:diguanylate cyclase (GGDEF)-like protein
MIAAVQREAGAARAGEHEDLLRLARTVAEVHWLLVLLVIAYLLLGGAADNPLGSAAVSTGLYFYTALAVAFRYAKLLRRETRWKIGVETLAMIALVTWAVYFTGGPRSPLADTYLLPVVTSALALGRLPTLAALVLIAACQVFVTVSSVREILSTSVAAHIVAEFAPLAFVAYVTTVFSADVRHGLSVAKAQSHTDDLTGLYNRRGFGLLASRRLSKATAQSRPAGLIMIDSDNLKAVNDTHGHQSGNRLLKHLAQAIEAQLRTSDIAGRYGGDEFIVLLHDTPPAGVIEVAERIRQAIAGAPLDFFGKTVTATVSVGVACSPEDGQSVDTLLAHADRGLYAAKQQGRNRTVRAARQPA